LLQSGWRANQGRWLELPQWVLDQAACLGDPHGGNAAYRAAAKQADLFGLPGAARPDPGVRAAIRRA
jgi:hypothetical protein